MFNRFMFFFIIILFYGDLFAIPIISVNNIIEKNITPLIECRTDENNTIFKVYNKNVINFGYIPNHGVWCQFSLKNDTNKIQNIILEYADPVATNIVLYDINKSKIYTDGYYYDKSWSINPTFDITLSPHKIYNYKIFSFSDSSALNVILKLWNPKIFEKVQRNHQVILALFFGAILALLIYNFFIYFFTREVMYLTYVLYLFFLILHQIVYTTFWELFIPLELRLSFEGELFSSFIIIMLPLSALIFTYSFLKFKDYPKINLTYKILISFALSYLILSLYPPFCSMTISVYISMFNGFFILFCGWYLVFKGEKNILLIVIGWTLALGSLLLMGLRNLDMVPIFDIFAYTAELGFFSEALLFSAALSQRLKMLETEKTRAKIFEKEAKSKELLLNELHHRVKNNLQFIYAIFSLQKRRTDSDLLIEGLQIAQNRVLSISKAHELLYKNSNFEYVQSSTYFQDIAQNIISLSLNNKITLHVESSLKLSFKQAVYCGLIINELVSNSVKYAFDDSTGDLTIATHLQNDNVILHVSDNGKGTKLPITSSQTLGIKLVGLLVEKELNGNVKYKNNRGLHITIKFKYETI